MQDSFFTLQTLGTVLSLRISDSSSHEEEFSRITELCQSFDRRYSRFIPGNYLDTLNAHGGGEVDDVLEDMLSFALELARLSDGYFDPTIGPLLSAHGYGNVNAAAVSLEKISYGCENVILSGKQLILKNDVRIELGGVGKGYLLEKIVHLLHPYKRFIVDFGGDIYARGGWDIALEHPHDATLAIGTIHIEDGYFCASSGLKRKFGTFHHLLDAHTRLPAGEVIASFVESDHGMTADGYATLLCVCPLEKSKELLHSGAIEGGIVTSEGKIFLSKHTKISVFS